MKTFEEFDTIDEKEEIFLELAHLDELDIKFDLLGDEYYYLFYFYKEKCLFINSKLNKGFFINYDEIWYSFGNNHKKTQDFLTIMVEKYFKISGYDVLWSSMVFIW